MIVLLVLGVIAVVVGVYLAQTNKGSRGIQEPGLVVGLLVSSVLSLSLSVSLPAHSRLSPPAIAAWSSGLTR